MTKLSDKKWHVHKKIVCAKYQLLVVASFAPAGDQSCNFSKKARFFIYSVFMSSFVSFFMAITPIVTIRMCLEHSYAKASLMFNIYSPRINGPYDELLHFTE